MAIGRTARELLCARTADPAAGECEALGEGLGAVESLTRIFLYQIVTAATEARMKLGVSQSAFAQLLGVSVRTLQEWEQGRREPSGAARTLLRIALKSPEVILQAG
jgi:DNA-binding XRE family transcriptional regulator